MIIFIIPLVYIIWIVDIIRMFSAQPNSYVLSSGLMCFISGTLFEEHYAVSIILCFLILLLNYLMTFKK